MTRRNVTIKDVAGAVGVSVYSASRALNGQSGVADGTRARVVAAAEQLGYVPNRLAQSLRRQDSKIVGVLTANSANAFYAVLVAGIDSVVNTDGFHTVTSDVTEQGVYSPVREEAFLRSLVEMRVAGVVCTYQPQLDQMQRLADWRIPVVFVDCVPPKGFADYPYIMNPGEKASEEVGHHFAEHDYGHWAFVGHSPDWPTRQARQRGFLKAAMQTGARVDVVDAGNDIEPAGRAVRAYLDDPRSAGVRAIYASNEPLLNGTWRELRRRGLRVPQDVALVGFDEFTWSDLLRPAVSVVDQNIRRMGEMAGSRILAAIGGQTDAAPGELPPPDPVLVLRESCGCPPSADVIT